MISTFSLAQTVIELERQIRANRMMNLTVDWQDEIIFPHFDGLSIYNLAQTILNFFGVNTDTPLNRTVWGEKSPIGQVDRVVLFLTDGLGYKWLRQLAVEDAEIHELIAEITDGRGFVPLTSIAPSTTAVALPTLWTGAYPAQHGMLGTTMFLRELSMMVNMLRFAPNIGHMPPNFLEELGLSPETFIAVPSIAQQLQAVDVPTHLLLAKKLMGTGLSRVLHRGVTHRHKHSATIDMWLRLQDVLTETSGQRCYVSVYWELVDVLSHDYGAHNRYTANEIKHQLRQLRAVLADEKLHDGRTAVMIVADHGHYDVPEFIDYMNDPRLQVLQDSLQRVPSAEARFGLFQVQDAKKSQIMQVFQEDFADTILCLDVDEAIGAGLFGKITDHPELIHRLGNLIITPRQGIRLTDKIRNFVSISRHGGLSDWEMLVPFMWKQI